MPNTTVAIRATRICSASVAAPLRTTCRKMSCESVLAPASVSPATTARMVAKATAAMNPRNGVPPSSSATSGAAMLPPASIRRISVAADQRRGAEPDDRNDQIEVADESGGVEHGGAGRSGVGHGVEAHQDVRQSEQPEHQREAERDGVDRIADQAAGLERRLTVARRDRGVEARRARSRSCARTSTVSSVTPKSSSTALMICTQVVAIMPPNST